MAVRVQSYRESEIARRVAEGINSTPESAAWSVDYGAGYAAGKSDAVALAYRTPLGANEAYSAGYQRGYHWQRSHGTVQS